MVTTVPPVVLPLLRLNAVTLGAVPAEYVKWSLDDTADVPVGVVTTTSTVPAAIGGDTAVIAVDEFTTNDAASTPPNVTAVALVKLVPLIVTEVPPALEPLLVPRLLTAGADAAE
jgi:hypothetical protein